MSQEWYYSVDGDRQGPVTAADLKKLADAGTLKPADLVWKDGMTDWAPAKSVKGLFGAGSGGSSAKPEEPKEAAPAKEKKSSLMDRLDSVKGREVEDDDRPSRRRRDEEEDDRPRARGRDEEEDRPRSRRRDEDEDDRPRSRRRDEDEDDDRPVRSRRRDEDEDDDRPARRRSKGGRVPDDVSSTKMVAGLLGILLGGFGVHKFYLGFTGAGVITLVVSFLTCGAFGIIGLIEGIIYLTKSDEDFYREYIVDQKQWF